MVKTKCFNSFKPQWNIISSKSYLNVGCLSRLKPWTNEAPLSMVSWAWFRSAVECHCSKVGNGHTDATALWVEPFRMGPEPSFLDRVSHWSSFPIWMKSVLLKQQMIRLPRSKKEKLSKWLEPGFTLRRTFCRKLIALTAPFSWLLLERPSCSHLVQCS